MSENLWDESHKVSVKPCTFKRPELVEFSLEREKEKILLYGR